MEIGIVLVTENKEKWRTVFNEKLIFNTLTDEHILRILFLQKIKISQSIDDIVKIYLDDLTLEDFTLSQKLYKILKYSSNEYNLKILDINNGYNIEEVNIYNKKVDLYKK